MEFKKEYPTAYKYDKPLSVMMPLRCYYRIKLQGEIQEFKFLVDALASTDISETNIMTEAIAFGEPNDYYNCFSCSVGNRPKAHYHLDLVNALGAWDLTRGSNCIKIGITDIEFQSHDDLTSKLVTTTNTASVGPASWNPTHGVEVAGMAAAHTNNNMGISALGYNVNLSYYDGLNFDAILAAIMDGCKVVNCSWGWYGSTTLETPTGGQQYVLDLANSNNVTIVAAAGNGVPSPDVYVYPASYDGVISVTSIGSQFAVNDPTNFSNWIDCHRDINNPSDPSYNITHQHNDRVDICAPGYGVETTTRNHTYWWSKGTSLAAPIVSAAAALLYSINPYFTPAQIESYLKNSAADISAIHDNYLWNGLLGAGRLDAGAALQLAAPDAYTQSYIGDIIWRDNQSWAIIPNDDYYRYNQIMVSIVWQGIPPCDLQDRYGDIEWIVKWGEEELHGTGPYAIIDLARDFTATVPLRQCRFPFEVYFRHKDCEDACSYSVYYKESGAKLSCRPTASNGPVLHVATHPKEIEKLKVYPSPAANKIKIVAPWIGEQNESEYLLYNTLGKVVKKGMIAGAKEIDISDLPAGIYIVKVSNGTHRSVCFIKQ